MFRWRWTSDAQPRSKKGSPHHNTTGVASTSCSHTAAPPGSNARKCSVIANATNGNDSATPIQNRRVMSASSGLAASAAVGAIGSSAMPQIGQLPGPLRTISGCIGQVHWPAPPIGCGSVVIAGVR
jgi:hypothetical protein